jgi:hypothetical protein
MTVTGASPMAVGVGTRRTGTAESSPAGAPFEGAAQVDLGIATPGGSAIECSNRDRSVDDGGHGTSDPGAEPQCRQRGPSGEDCGHLVEINEPFARRCKRI